MTFKVHSFDDAPAESKSALRKIQDQRGFLPNLFAVMCDSPAVINAYAHLETCMGKTDLTDKERDIVYLTVSFKNDSKYCITAHTNDAEAHKLTQKEIEAFKTGKPLRDAKLEAVRQYTLGVMENQGRPSDHAIECFLKEGYTPKHALEIVLGITLKTLTNYTARLAHPAIDFSLGNIGKETLGTLVYKRKSEAS